MDEIGSQYFIFINLLFGSFHNVFGQKFVDGFKVWADNIEL